MIYAKVEMDVANKENYGLQENHQLKDDFSKMRRKAELIKRFTESGLKLQSEEITLDQFALELAEEHLQLEEAAEYDPLTGLLNRRGFANNFDNKLLGFRRALHASNQQDGTKILGSVAVLDLDKFGLVNKEYGEPVGDALLQQVAATLIESIRPEDITARFGGEEFIIFLEGANLENACHVIERIRQNLPDQTAMKLNDLKVPPIRQTASFGVVQLSDNLTEEDLMEPKIRGHIFSESYTKSVRAMRFAKENDRDRTVAAHSDGRLEVVFINVSHH